MTAAESFDALFAPEPEASGDDSGSEATWKILLVDDEPDIHAVLRLALTGVRVEDRPLQMLDAYSAVEARDVIEAHPDIALALLDVVMETHRAGLDLIRHIREALGNRNLQIVLVTGQPGYAPSREVMWEHAIHSYQVKSELTTDRVFVSVYAAIRTHQTLLELEGLRQNLESKVKQRTAELEASHQRLTETQFALDRVGIASHWVDSQGHFVYVNDAACEMLGYAREEFLKLGVPDIDPDFPSERFEEAVRPFKEQGYARFESYNRHKDGRLIPVEVILYYREQDPGTGKFIGFIIDISQRKQTEQALIAARQAAEAASEAKSAFLANMSHELRTPMNAIVGLTHLLQRGIHDPGQLDKLNKIAESTHHLLSVINSILDISKIEAGKFSLEEAEFEFDPLLSGVVALVLDKARAKDLEVVIDSEPRLSQLLLRGDPTRLTQALLNYAGNAVKFTERGTVIVRARIVEETHIDLLARFEVRDTGSGIPEDALPRLFQAFEQADNTATRRHGGTGLGLAITQRLAALMGGEVGVDSQPGQGSTFWFTARLGKIPRPDARPHPRQYLAGQRALVVDDSAEARAVLAGMLDALGVRTDSVEDGEQALARIQSSDRSGEPYDLVVLDWQMPRLDGMETARRLRDLPLSKPPARLLVTAYDEPDLRETAQRVGFDSVLIKPVTPSTLHDTLMRVLGGHSAAPSPAPRIAHDFHQARVLLCEDNPINQEVATELLEGAGFRIDLAENGAVAVEKAQQAEYDLILMDMQMPVMDGLEAARTIRALPGHAALPIVAMTANAFSEDRRRCLEAGMNDHVAKPVNPEAMFATLAKWLPSQAVEAAASDPRQPGQSGLEQRLAGIPGLDVGAGLGMIGGKLDRYAGLLRMFAQHHADDVAQMRAQLAEGNADAAERLAHNLKGASGTIGASRLHSLAARINLAIQVRQPFQEIEPALDEFECELKAFRDAVLGMLSEQEQAVQTVDRQKAAQILARIEQFLAEDDTQAATLTQDSAALLLQAYGPEMEAIKRLIESFDYEPALDGVRALRARHAQQPARTR